MTDQKKYTEAHFAAAIAEFDAAFAKALASAAIYKARVQELLDSISKSKAPPPLTEEERSALLVTIGNPEISKR